MHNDFGLKALNYLQKMQLATFIPDSITFVSIHFVCATRITLKWVMKIHGKITRYGFLLHAIMIIIYTCMKNMGALIW